MPIAKDVKDVLPWEEAGKMAFRPLYSCVSVSVILSLFVGLRAGGEDLIVRPAADGTLVDGGGYGTFDGQADAADWSFNGSSYEGAITLVLGQPSLETRVVFEYSLTSLTPKLPVVAGLRFPLRGAARFPAELASVQVYAYPADLLERNSDFAAGPAAFCGEVWIAPFADNTWHEINVTSVVSAGISWMDQRVAFRFQLAPESVDGQVFMDVADSDPAGKPYLVLYGAVPGDFDGNREVSLADFLHFYDCLRGPNSPIPLDCEIVEATGDGVVELRDFAQFENNLSLFGQ